MHLETESKDTRGNAQGVARIMGRGPFILVTTAVHIPRSMLAFRKSGMSVLAAPTDYLAKRTPLTLSDFFPNAYSMNNVAFALHEYFGLIYYYLT